MWCVKPIDRSNDLMSYWTIEEMTEENYSTFLRLEDEKEEILCNYPVPGISFNPLHYKGTNKQSRDISLLQYKLNLFPKYFLHFLFKKSHKKFTILLLSLVTSTRYVLAREFS